MDKLVKLEIRGELAWVILDNPPMNALGDKAKFDLGLVLDELEKAVAELRAVIITGVGKAFVAGSDIKKFLSLDVKSATEQSMKSKRLFNRLEGFERPTIAAINGYCFGAGVELALCCDVRIAADGVTMGCPEVSLGIIPGVGATQRLPRLVGLGRAKELIMSGRRITADKALAIGMVERVVSMDQLLKEAENMARNMAAQGPLAVAAAKRTINRGWDLNLEEGLDLESRTWGELFGSEDQKEGARAFLGKRKPVFKGR